MSPMTNPTDQDIRAALEEHAIEIDGEWAFRSHLMNVYSEAEALALTKVNLMLGTAPNGSLTAEMLVAFVDRIAAVEARLTGEMGA
jgi:hydroxypyruvate isomerase